MKHPHEPITKSKRQARLQAIMKVVAVIMIVMLALPLLGAFNW